MSGYDMFEGYDDIEETHGFDTDPLPTNWYHLMIEKVLGTEATKNGAVQARCQVIVESGELKGKRAFVNILLGPSSVNKDGTARSDVERQKAAGSIMGQMKGFMKSIGCNTGAPTGDGDVDKAASFYNVGTWDTRQFIGNVKYRPAQGKWGASNQLNGYHGLEDEKKGLEWLNNQSSGSGTNEAQTV